MSKTRVPDQGCALPSRRDDRIRNMKLAPVCTENLIPLRKRANRLRSLGDQAPLLHSGRIGLAVQVEGAAGL
jgi:hypothetical protein